MDLGDIAKTLCLGGIVGTVSGLVGTGVYALVTGDNSMYSVTPYVAGSLGLGVTALALNKTVRNEPPSKYKR